MATKREQATKILQDALGAGAETPPPPPSTPPPVAEAPPPEPVTDGQETAADDGVADEAASLADLANALGVEVSELYGVHVPMPNGEEPITLGTLKDAENRARKLERQLRGLESDYETSRKEVDTLRSQGTQAFGGIPAELDEARLLAAQWHRHLHNNDAFWNQLKADDPAQYAAELTQAQMHAQHAAQQFQQGMLQWQQVQQRQMQDLLADKRRKLAEADAAWADEGTRKERYKAISEWLRSEGADVPSNLDEVLVDPGWANALHKAAAASQGLKAVEGGTPRKVGTAKLTRGALKRGGNTGGKLVDIIKRAKESGRSADKRAAGEAILANAFSKKPR